MHYNNFDIRVYENLGSYCCLIDAAATAMSKSRVSAWSRLIQTQIRFFNTSSRSFSVSSPIPRSITANPRHFQNLPFPNSQCGLAGTRFFSNDNPITALLVELKREVQKERDEKERLGLDTADIDAEDEELDKFIENLEKDKLKGPDDMMYEEPTDSDSDDDDERFTPEAIQKRSDEFEKKFKRHEELLKNFTDARNLLT